MFALFQTLGTNNNLAVRDFLNQSGVPHLFVASGANTWGAEYKKYPWTIGFIPSYILEGRVYGRYIAKSFPTLKLGVLYQDDAYGKDLVAGLKKGLGAKRSRSSRSSATTRRARASPRRWRRSRRRRRTPS